MEPSNSGTLLSNEKHTTTTKQATEEPHSTYGVSFLINLLPLKNNNKHATVWRTRKALN